MTSTRAPIKVMKTAPGLDPHGYLPERLGGDFSVSEADFRRPLTEQVADIDVFLTRDVAITAAVIDAAPKLRLIQRYGHHVVNVDLDHARNKSVPVARIPSNVSGSNLVVAEHAFFLMIALAKRFRDSERALAANRLGRPETMLLAGKTLGLIGVGGTGAELARLAKAFGMSTIAVKRNLASLDGGEAYIDRAMPIAEIDTMLGVADFVSLHLPLSAETTGFVGRSVFAAMKPTAMFINVARGEIVDRNALVDALTRGTIAGAGIDVFWDEGAFDYAPLAAVANLICTPHIAGASIDCLLRLAEAGAENIVRIARGDEPLHRVA